MRRAENTTLRILGAMISPIDTGGQSRVSIGEIVGTRLSILVDKALGRVTARDSILSERAAAAVWAAMKAKIKIGIGMKSKKTMKKKRILPTVKRGGYRFQCWARLDP